MLFEPNHNSVWCSTVCLPVRIWHFILIDTREMFRKVHLNHGNIWGLRSSKGFAWIICLTLPFVNEIAVDKFSQLSFKHVQKLMNISLFLHFFSPTIIFISLPLILCWIFLKNGSINLINKSRFKLFFHKAQFELMHFLLSISQTQDAINSLPSGSCFHGKCTHKHYEAF